ncbi:MAG: family 78 glycoside hydrolase catalytic domain [Lentisphaeria bacterium]|nr:family 78 glycoside hydrolase catalytic domain [Lentisphaeria bacterium]
MRFIDQTNWIWTDQQDNTPDLYRLFRKDFTYTPGREPVFLEISVCSTFELQINGKMLCGQQVSDFPAFPTGACFDVTDMLIAGENRLLLQVHYIGEDFLTGLAGKPFVKLALFRGDELLLGSDSTWEWCIDKHFRSGLCCKVTPQLGFAFEYSAEIPAEELWQKAAVLDEAFDGIRISKRRVPQLQELPHPEAEVVQTGVLQRSSRTESFAVSCMTDFLRFVPFFDFYDGVDQAFFTRYVNRNFKLLPDGSTPLKIRGFDADGVYVILDLGREQVGYLSLDMTAPAGTVVDIAHGEHLAAGRVSAQIEKRNFADRYVCREGRNKFVFRHRRLGCRYLELHILTKSPVEITYCGLIPLELPLPQEATFDCEDRLLLKNRELAVRTLNLCMHEHYEDCPWREQALYGYDSRNQILYGYYVWGNYGFAANSIDLLGKSFDGERYFSLSAPGRLQSRTIPIFTLIWITELLEYQLFSGNGELFTKWQSLTDQILEAALVHKVPGNEAFYHPGKEAHIWNFCEWNERLCDVREHPSSTYNVYLYEALIAASKLHRFAGNTGRAEQLQCVAGRLGEALKARFWNDKLKVFMLTQNDGSLEEYEHVQAVFLANGLAEEHQDDLLQSFLFRRLNGITFSGLPYFVKALQRLGKEGRSYLYEYLDKLFTPMLLAGSTSLWETADGSTAFNRAGSLCHAWSSVIPYYCGSHLLGVRPLEPGFARFEVRPFCGKLTHAGGEIPVPGGFIRVSWQLRDGMIELELEHPEGMVPEIRAFEEFPIRSVNGKPL